MHAYAEILYKYNYIMSVTMDPEKIMKIPPLLHAYTDDIIRWAIRTFKSKDISISRLKQWKKKYPIIYPWDPEYNTERLGYNRIIQVYPLAIVMAKRKRDIQWALKKAIELKITFSLKNGGHDHTGACLCDGFIINVSNRDKILVDSKHRYVKIGCGVVLGELDLELANKDCSWIPHGTCANVSCLSLSLSAGIGALTRKYGLTIDHLLGATVILADGSIVTANEKENADLFWMLRGCGTSTVGIVTDIKLKIHKSQEVVLFELKYNTEQLSKVLQMWDNFGPYTENNLASKILFFPNSNTSVDFHVCLKGQYEGTVSQLNTLLKDFISFALCVNIWTATPIDAAIFYNQGSAEPPWYFFYETLFTVEPMNDKTIQVLCDFSKSADIEYSVVLNALGGKMAEVSNEETAFPWRNAKLWIHIMSETRDQRKHAEMEKCVKYLYHGLLDSGLRNDETGVGRLYINFKDLDLTKDQYPLAYWGNNYQKILEIKHKYDPNNIFRPIHGVLG